MALLAQMRPALLKYFKRKTGSDAEAEDLTQDVLVRTLTRVAGKSPEQAKGYLFRSAVNRWRDRRRRDRTRTPTVELSEVAEEDLGSGTSTDCVLIVREEVEEILRALEDMNERTRTVLMMIKIEQMTPLMTADLLGISERAVYKHLAIGLKLLMRLRRRREWLR